MVEHLKKNRNCLILSYGIRFLNVLQVIRLAKILSAYLYYPWF